MSMVTASLHLRILLFCWVAAQFLLAESAAKSVATWQELLSALRDPLIERISVLSPGIELPEVTDAVVVDRNVTIEGVELSDGLAKIDFVGNWAIGLAEGRPDAPAMHLSLFGTDQMGVHVTFKRLQINGLQWRLVGDQAPHGVSFSFDHCVLKGLEYPGVNWEYIKSNLRVEDRMNLANESHICNGVCPEAVLFSLKGGSMGFNYEGESPTGQIELVQTVIVNDDAIRQHVYNQEQFIEDVEDSRAASKTVILTLWEDLEISKCPVAVPQYTVIQGASRNIQMHFKASNSCFQMPLNGSIQFQNLIVVYDGDDVGGLVPFVRANSSNVIEMKNVVYVRKFANTADVVKEALVESVVTDGGIGQSEVGVVLEEECKLDFFRAARKPSVGCLNGTVCHKICKMGALDVTESAFDADGIAVYMYNTLITSSEIAPSSWDPSENGTSSRGSPLLVFLALFFGFVAVAIIVFITFFIAERLRANHKRRVFPKMMDELDHADDMGEIALTVSKLKEARNPDKQWDFTEPLSAQPTSITSSSHDLDSVNDTLDRLHVNVGVPGSPQPWGVQNSRESQYFRQTLSQQPLKDLIRTHTLSGKARQLNLRLDVSLLNQPKLGSGGTGTVWKGVLGDGTLVAVKIAGGGLYSYELSAKGIQNELKAFADITPHPNVIDCHGGNLSEHNAMERIYIVEELMDRNLSSVIHDANDMKACKYSTLLRIFLDVVNGLQHLHKSHVYHYDLKPSNVLLSADMTAKVADFGLCSLKERSSITPVRKGTLRYMAPEIYFAAYFIMHVTGEKIDVYSLGVVMWEAISGEKLETIKSNCTDKSSPSHHSHDPLVPKNALSDCELSVEERCRRRFALPEYCPKEMQELVGDCTKFQNEDRPCLKDVGERLGAFMTAEWAFDPVRRIQ